MSGPAERTEQCGRCGRMFYWLTCSAPTYGNVCSDCFHEWVHNIPLVEPDTPAPVCTECGSHINPDYGKGPVCGACKDKPEVSPLKESLDGIAGALVDTLMRKNTDYGDSYRRLRDEFGPDSFLIRLGDKYNRLIALRGKEALVSETTDDTIRDIAGYCLLEMAYRKEAERCG